MNILGLMWIPDWLLLILLLAVTYVIYACKDFGRFKTMGVPGPNPFPLIGNSNVYFKMGLNNAQSYWYKKYGRVFGIFEMKSPMLCVGDPEMLKEILVKQFDNFRNRDNVFKQGSPFDDMIFFLKDGHWKHVRSTLTPTFSTAKLKSMTGLINSACDKLVCNLVKKAENKEDVEIKEACLAFSIDVVASTAFGIQIDSQENPDDPFVVYGKSLLKVKPLAVFIFMFLPRLLPYLSKLPSERKDAIRFFENVVRETFNQRKSDSEKRNDFLQLMVTAEAAEIEADSTETNDGVGSKDTRRKGLTLEVITAQSVGFFMAGMENTAWFLSMLLYCLALYPDILEKTLEEIDRVVGKMEEVTYEKASELHYLEQVLCETERLYPTSPRLDRVCTTTTTINGITIPKGMIINIPASSIQRDNEFWPNPDKFDPDRFRPEVKGDINPVTFLPFGYGPRNCIAMRLSQVEVKISAAKILQKLKPVKVSRTQENPELSKLISTQINGGSWIGLEKRE